MRWERATMTELYTIASHDSHATVQDRWMAAHEIVKRQRKMRKPYRNNQMKIRKAYPRF